MNYITLLFFYLSLFLIPHARAALIEELVTVLSYPSKSTGSLETIVAAMDNYAPTLKELSIIGRFQEEMDAILERLPNCIGLNVLDLSVCELDTQKVTLLLGYLPWSLTTLILDGNPIDESVLETLEEWINNRPAVETVRLAGTKVDHYMINHPKIQMKIPSDGQPILGCIFPAIPEGYGQT